MRYASPKVRAGALLAVVSLAASAGLITAAHATTSASLQVVRLGGADRFATAQVVSAHGFPSGAPVAVLARGEDFSPTSLGFADALAANYLAGYLGAPILLTDGTSVPAATLQTLQDLKVKDVVVMGGTNAVSSGVFTQLQNTASAAGGDFTVTRVAGTDRYQTAALAAETAPASFVKSIGGVPTALVATGDNFPDALAGGPLAYASHLPLLLTSPTSLSTSAQQALQALGIKSVIILGGTGAVSSSTEQAIQALGITTKRLSGADRQATAMAIADYAISTLGFSSSTLYLARGDAYPDALTGGPAAGVSGPAPILLTSSPTSLGSGLVSFLTSAAPTLTQVDVLGLQGAFSDSLLSTLEGLLGVTTTTTVPGNTSTTVAGTLPGLGVPGLGTLLAGLTSSQQSTLLPALGALSLPQLDLIGTLIQSVPLSQLPGLGALLGQPTSFLSTLSALAPALPTGGFANLGNLLSVLPTGQVSSVGQLLSALPVGSVPSLASLLSSLPASQQSPLGGLLSAANSSQLGIISQVLSDVTGGILGGLLNTLLGQLSGLPGSSVLSSLSVANATQLHSLLGSLSGTQVTALGGILSGLGSNPATDLGSLLGSLSFGGAANLGGLLSALPTGSAGTLGSILSVLPVSGSNALAGLLHGVPVSSLPDVSQILTALP